MDEFFSDAQTANDIQDVFKLKFETPVRLKKDRHIIDTPEFYSIMRSIIHKLNVYSFFYGGGVIERNVAGILEEAKRVEIVWADTSFKQYVYYSRIAYLALFLQGYTVCDPRIGDGNRPEHR